MLDIGLVFLDDLRAFGSWISDRAPAWARARALHGKLLPPTIFPPPITIVVAKTIAWSQLETSAPWLRLAKHVIIVLDATDDPTTRDPNHAELTAYERNELTASLNGRVTFLDAPQQSLEQTIDEALRLADQTVAETHWTHWTPLPLAPAVDPGPWIDWDIPRRPSLTIERADILRLLAPAICRPEGRPAVLDGLSGIRIDLQTGSRTPIDGLAGTSSLWSPIAAMPSGKRWLRASERNAFRLEGTPAGSTLTGGWGSPIGMDSSGQIAWVGGRCMFDFRVVTEHGAAYWTPSNHDWPCGHGKKLYGFKDNEPQFVVLANDASACLSTYEHDTLLTPQLPLVWRDVGGFALAERMRGEPRALLFCRSDEDDVFPGDPFAAEEDARDEFVVATLGPSSRHRYTVSLEKPTYRLVQDRVERLGGPSLEWIVCNDQHEVVRRASGRLLGGFGPWVVIEHAGELWRENITTAQRRALGPAGKTVLAAVPVAGTPNVVLIHLHDGQPQLRLV